MAYFSESFSPDEEAALSRFFTSVDGPVFALVNLPEVVKGALFARYSRSAKSLRRLFLDEFVADPEAGVTMIAATGPDVDLRRAERLYDRVFVEYGDDSVAQLGGAHLACEQVSNVLTKALERGRLAAYLEQSTRYIPYDTKLGGRWRYTRPPELDGSPLAAEYTAHLSDSFETYTAVAARMGDVYRARHARDETISPRAHEASVMAKAYDAARGLLPAATLSNLGIFASGQAFERLLVRLQAHPLAEARHYGDLMLTELRTVIPSFLTRVDRPDRGVRWSRYLADTTAALTEVAADLAGTEPAEPEPWSVRLTDWDPDAETKLVAAALYPVTELSDSRLGEMAAAMTAEERARVAAALVGDRENRRHLPGRALERPVYRFDVVCDFGAFRDLQRHRLLTLEWQRFTTRLGHDIPDDIVEAGLDGEWERVMGGAAALAERIRQAHGPDVAQYVVPFAAHVRFVVEMNAREAFHLIELRSQPAGHPNYRRVAREMHRQIAEVAGHRLIADAMTFVDHTEPGLERLAGELRAEERRLRAGS